MAIGFHLGSLSQHLHLSTHTSERCFALKGVHTSSVFTSRPFMFCCQRAQNLCFMPGPEPTEGPPPPEPTEGPPPPEPTEGPPPPEPTEGPPPGTTEYIEPPAPGPTGTPGGIAKQTISFPSGETWLLCAIFFSQKDKILFAKKFPK